MNKLNNIKIEDDKIKFLINKYKENNNNLSNIIEYLSPLIYSFPRITTKYINEDDCSDFYEYILKRFEKIINGYNETDVKFITWFSVVLKRHFFNWLKTKSKKIKEIYILNAPISNDKKDEIINKIAYEEHHSNFKNIDIRNLINSLPLKYRIVLKLHYFDFFVEEDIFEIIECFGGDLKLLLEKYHELLRNIENQNKNISKLEESLIKLYKKIYESKKEEDDYKNWISNYLDEDIFLIKEKHKKQIKNLKNNYLSIKAKDIADFLKIDIKETYNLLHNAKLMLKEKIIKKNLI